MNTMTLQTACPACRATVSLTPDEVVLAGRPEAHTTYTLVCPDCGAVAAKRVDAIVEWLLRAAGAVPVPVAREGQSRKPPEPGLRVETLPEHRRLRLAGTSRNPGPTRCGDPGARERDQRRWPLPRHLH